MPNPDPRAEAALRLQQTEHARAAKLTAAQRAGQAQQKAATEAAALAQQRAEAAARLRGLEDRVDDTAYRLAAATAARRAALAEIARRTADIQALLPLALRLSLYPSETILAVPAPPDQALEGLLLTHGLSAELARQVAELRRREAQAASLEKNVAQTAKVLAGQRAAQEMQAASLDRQLGKAQALAQAALDQSGAASLQASLLAAKAADLRGAIAAMEAVPPQAASRRAPASAPDAGPGLADAARIRLVAGRVAQAWGAPAEDGPAMGVTFSTAPAAFVVSPCTGRVGFSGPFRSYGRLIILECGGGDDFVLAGLDRLDVAVGTHVRAGEPVGRMADYDPARATDRPGLYVELRHAGQPVNPMPYLRGKS